MFRGRGITQSSLDINTRKPASRNPNHSWVQAQPVEEARGMRDYCVAKTATQRAARPDSLRLRSGVGSHGAKNACSKDETKLRHFRPMLYNHLLPANCASPITSR